MWLALVAIVLPLAALFGWRWVGPAWHVETPRQALEAAWYRLNPPRSLSIGALQQRIMRAAVGARVVSVRGVALVPSTFEVALNPDDLQAIDGVRDWIARELGEALAERAAAEGWQVEGHPVVTFVADPARVPGRPDVRARHESRTVHAPLPDRVGPVPVPLDVEPVVGWLRPLGDEDPIALTAGVALVLGRGSSASVDLGHHEVSRRHCELAPSAGGWTVRDLGSANGTEVNQRPVVEPTRLHVGDTLVIAGQIRFVAEAIDPRTRVAPDTGMMPATRVHSGPAARAASVPG